MQTSEAEFLGWGWSVPGLERFQPKGMESIGRTQWHCALERVLGDAWAPLEHLPVSVRSFSEEDIVEVGVPSDLDPMPNETSGCTPPLVLVQIQNIAACCFC